jgi:hypothetical protein
VAPALAMQSVDTRFFRRSLIAAAVRDSESGTAELGLGAAL